MPTKRKPGTKVVFVETPQALAERLAAVAEQNHRSITGEAIVAFERHVKAEEARLRAEAGTEQGQAKEVKPKDKGRKVKGE